MATTFSQHEFTHALRNGHNFSGKFITLCSVYVENSAEKLPDNLTIKGNFSTLSMCGRCRLKELPKKFRVDGFVDIRNSLITKIPDDMIVDPKVSVLLLDGTKITRLPKTITPLYVYYDKQVMSVERYNQYRAHENFVKVLFFAQKIKTIAKLLEIPELFDEVYYRHKNEFLSLMNKL